MIKSVSFVIELINVNSDELTVIVRLMDGRPVSITSSLSKLEDELNNLLNVAACEGREHEK